MGPCAVQGETVRRILCAVLAVLSSAVILPSSVSADTLPPVVKTPGVVRASHHHVASHTRAGAHKAPILSDVAALARVTIGELRAEWQHVAMCEVGGNWSMLGPSYSGIGFANSTWLQYGGSRFAPLAGQAPRDVQILIGMKVTGGWVPDQQGCSPGGW
jgi:hypothetical protein